MSQYVMSMLRVSKRKPFSCAVFGMMWRNFGGIGGNHGQ